MKSYAATDLTLFNSCGLFNNPLSGAPNVPPRTLATIIEEMDNWKRGVWSDDHFDPSKPPAGNTGVNLCYDCGKVYWVTPQEDAYQKEGQAGLGSVCEPCLVTEGPVKRKDADFLKVSIGKDSILLPMEKGYLVKGDN